MKIFISGKVSGLDYNAVVRRFQFHKRKWRAKGYEVIIPTDICNADWCWLKCMFYCLLALSKCDEVFFLNNWKDSRGARKEHFFAKLLKKKIIYEFEIV